MSHVTLSRGWQPSVQSSLWFLFRICFPTLRPEIKHFRIHKKCYFSVKFVVSVIIFVNVCGYDTSSLRFAVHMKITFLLIIFNMLGIALQSHRKACAELSRSVFSRRRKKIKFLYPKL